MFVICMMANHIIHTIIALWKGSHMYEEYISDKIGNRILKNGGIYLFVVTNLTFIVSGKQDSLMHSIFFMIIQLFLELLHQFRLLLVTKRSHIAAR